MIWLPNFLRKKPSASIVVKNDGGGAPTVALENFSALRRAIDNKEVSGEAVVSELCAKLGIDIKDVLHAIVKKSWDTEAVVTVEGLESRATVSEEFKRLMSNGGVSASVVVPALYSEMGIPVGGMLIDGFPVVGEQVKMAVVYNDEFLEVAHGLGFKNEDPQEAALDAILAAHGTVLADRFPLEDM
jgi:hypothetical protein